MLKKILLPRYLFAILFQTPHTKQPAFREHRLNGA